MDVRAENRGRPHQKVRFSAAPVIGRNFLTQGASGRKGQECPWEIRTKKFMFMLFFLPWGPYQKTENLLWVCNGDDKNGNGSM